MRQARMETTETAGSASARITMRRPGRAANARAADLTALIDAALELAAPQARRRGVQIETALASLPRARGEPLDILSVLEGLITNAIARSPAGGKVRIIAEASDAGAMVRVSDNGADLVQADLQRMMWPHAELSAKSSDVHLLDAEWLASVRSIEGSRIEGHCRQLGGGATTFSVLFPAQGTRSRRAQR